MIWTSLGTLYIWISQSGSRNAEPVPWEALSIPRPGSQDWAGHTQVLPAISSEALIVRVLTSCSVYT